MVKQLLLIVLVFIAISPAFAAGGSTKDLIEERCAGCHSLGLVYRAQKSEPGWEKTVDRMIGYGAQMDKEERTAVIKYLLEQQAK